MAQKTRLTYEYVNYSRQLYRETRMGAPAELPLAQQGRAPVALYGTEEGRAAQKASRLRWWAWPRVKRSRMNWWK